MLKNPDPKFTTNSSPPKFDPAEMKLYFTIVLCKDSGACPGFCFRGSFNF